LKKKLKVKKNEAKSETLIEKDRRSKEKEGDVENLLRKLGVWVTERMEAKCKD